MSGILAKINALYKALPAAEQQVADHILRNGAQVPYQSVYEVADAAGVSVASVSRLAKKLSCSNFKDLKIEFAQELVSPVTFIYEGIGGNDSEDEMIHKVFTANMRGLEDTLKTLDTKVLIRTADLISKCRALIIFAMGSSGYIAKDAAFRFSLLGLNAHAYTDHLDSMSRAMALGKRDLVVGISHSGRSAITLRALKLARKQGVHTVGISNYFNSPLAKICDIAFCTAFPESAVKAAALSSRISQVCLIDALFLLVARSMKDFSFTEQVNELTELHFRTAGNIKKRPKK